MREAFATLKRRWQSRDNDAVGVVAAIPAVAALVRDIQYEVVPMRSIDQAVDALPESANVSVSCSPVRGIPATLEQVERLLGLGHRAIPHVAARLVEGSTHVDKLAEWLREHDVQEVFVIAGDVAEPLGPYDGSLAFLRALIDADPGVTRIGVAGYPDGHPAMSDALLREQLHAKQELFAGRGVGGWVSTQMCFDAETIRRWLSARRADGLTMPVRVGIPGVVDRTRLMTMGMRIGVGASLRYLGKNRASMSRLFAPGGFDPTEIVMDIARDADRLGVEGLHSFTFNAVADTRAWQETIVQGAQLRTVHQRSQLT